MLRLKPCYYDILWYVKFNNEMCQKIFPLGLILSFPSFSIFFSLQNKVLLTPETYWILLFLLWILPPICILSAELTTNHLIFYHYTTHFDFCVGFFKNLCSNYFSCLDYSDFRILLWLTSWAPQGELYHFNTSACFHHCGQLLNHYTLLFSSYLLLIAIILSIFNVYFLFIFTGVKLQTSQNIVNSLIQSITFLKRCK